MPETFLRDIDLAARYGVARNTIWRWTRERPDMPLPIRLSPGCTRWKLSDLEAWEAEKAEAVA
ncbi:helix-turn-helix transcriptional regulator [Rhodosalinus sp. K401]|uniref:helix-turn-helix transcriptional regulator n=1 Tax=Rhodosalinus sp. K401 TaxID=3239195 RepID=UPI003524A553